MDAIRSSSAGLGELAELTRQVSLAGEQALILLPVLESVLPSGSLQRGFTLSVQGGPGVNSLAIMQQHIAKATPFSHRVS